MAFDILSDKKSAPIGHQFVQCHVVFDIKMEDFRQKARLVAGGHMTEALATIMYTSIMSRETVRIALMIAALGDLEVELGCTGTCHRKVWTTLVLSLVKMTERLQ